MPSTSELKTRMVSVGETKKVTDAMYMISSVKMQRAKREHQNSEKYFRALEERIADLLTVISETENRYFHISLPEGREHFCHGILLITSDKGLVGAYNQTALKVAENYISRHPETVLFIVGEYGRQYFKSKKIPFVEDFNYSAAFPSIWDAQKMCIELLDWFQSEKLDDINIIYTEYMGAKPSICKRRVLLPLDKSSFYGKSDGEKIPFKEFFPDANTVLEGIMPSYLAGYIYSSLVDSYCSEQQARMLAMSTAGKNAEEMLRKLKMQYNAIRQAKITSEMIEITSGAKALKAKRKKKRAVTQ